MQLSKLSRAICTVLAGSTLAFTTAAKVDDTVKKTVQKGATAVSVANPAHFDGDLRKVKPAKQWQPGEPIKVANPRYISDVQTILPAVNKPNDKLFLVDKQRAVTNKTPRSAAPITGVNIDGVTFNGVNPPDPTGDIGLKYYIQSANDPSGSVLNIYDKTTGDLVAGPITMGSLQTGECASGAGDPIVLFDEQAKRWLLTEFTSPGSNRLCILVSKTEDPVTGGWYAYEYEAPSFPDYPKYSQMGGVYYASANEDLNALYSFERSKMLNGEPAAMVRMTAPNLAGFGFKSITPVDVDGAMDAPDGTPGLFIRHRDDEMHNSGANNPEKDYLELWMVTPDFENSDNSKVEGPFNIEISEIDSNFNCSNEHYGCLEQRDDGRTLDPLREVVNYKAQYRRFDGHASIVGNLITKVDENTAALRWFELRKTGDGDWTLHQEGTYTENDKVSRYMAGSLMDGSGNIALAYMMTGPSKFPSIGMNGRLADDAPGVLTFGEQILVEGSGPIPSTRDGDYSQMGVDPVDNCTIWFTSEYGKGDGQWSTRISSFAVPSCLDPNPGFTMSGNNLSQEVCASGDMAPMTVVASGYNDFDGDIKLTYVDLPEGISGSFSQDTIKTGIEATANVSIAEGTAAGDYVIKVQGASGSAKERLVSANLKLMDTVSTASPAEPAIDATNVSQLPTLKWSGDSRASSHMVEIAMDAEFSNIVATGTVSSGDSYRPSVVLSPNTMYYWRVKALNSCGENYSAVSKFTTGDERNGSTQLYKGIPTEAFDVAGDNISSFYVDVPEGSEDLSIVLAADNGDADIYISKDVRYENGGSLLCRSVLPSSQERCDFAGPVDQGSYFVTVHAYSAFTDATLMATYTGGGFIEGQQPVSLDEDTTLEIPMSAITVEDANYPTGYTLEVLPGHNYALTGNTIAPAGNYYGDLSVNVRLTNPDTDVEQYALQVTVNPVNDAPTITGSTDMSVEEDGSFQVQASHLTIVDIDNEDTSGFTVSVEAGDNYTVEGTDTVKPAENFNGALSVNVKVNDGEADSEMVTADLTVTPVNDAPTLVADTHTVQQDSAASTINVLANDSDIDEGDSLTLVSVSYSGTGSASVSGNNISYTPGNGFSGSETFEYTAKDSGGVEKSSTVTVTVQKKSSSGGSMSLAALLLLPLVALRRRKFK